MEIDTLKGLITVWMVQHAGFPRDGGRCACVFKNAVKDPFGRQVTAAK